MRKILLFILSCAISFNVLAQERTVTGKVTSAEDGTSLPGVNVLLKGTSTGVSTDANGTYAIQVPQEGGVLIFTFIGLETKEVEINQRSTVDVPLVSDITQLSEVVVVGYGTQQKKDVTGSISQVKGDALSSLAAPAFDRLLAGRATGVQVITPSGLLGQAPQIRIRGVNSISSGTDPLIVIDGVPAITGNLGGFTPANPLADINPNDIESYEILKDGAATAIYGSRAANGVILITTKKGRKGKTQFTYDGYVGIANVSKRLDLLNASQFVYIANERLRNAGQGEQANLDPNGVDTDWQDEVFQQAFQQNHAVSASGGTDKTQYYFSLGFSDQDGIIRTNSLTRYSLRGNVEQTVNKVLKFGLNSGFTAQENQGPLTGSNNLSGNIFGIMRMLPNVAVYNPADPTGYNIDASDRRALGRGANGITISDGIPNARFVLDKNTRTAKTYRLLGSTFIEAEIVKGLKFRTQIGIDGSFVEDINYSDPRTGDGQSASGIMSQSYSPTVRWNWQNILSYNKSFNDVHNIDVTLVSEYQKQRASFFQATVQNIADIYFNENIVSGTFVTPNAFGGVTYTGIESYLGRLNYNFKGKYYLGASLRADGLSSLPKDNRWGYFPSASVAWRISEEDFFKNSGVDFIYDLKLRGSFAEVGNTNIGSFPYLGTYGAALYGSQKGIGFNNTANEDLTWESQKIYDAGIDLSVLQGRINFTFAYWRKDNNNIILAAPTPPSLGVPGNSINRNVGSVRNSGLEFALEGEVLSGDNFKWNATVNFSTQQNEVLALLDNQDITDAYNVIRVGESIRAIYGYQYRGVNKANGNPLYEKADGTVIQGNIATSNYFVYNAAEPGVLGAATTLAANDRKVLGNSLPKWFGGFNNNFSYNNFDLNIFFRFQGGNYIMNRTRQDLLNMNFVNNGTEVLGRWQSPENPGDGQMPKLFASRSAFINLENQASTRFVEKGDFLRLDNVTLGYSVPSDKVKAVGLSKIRVYTSAQNLFVLTDYSGLDPETNTNGAGVDFNGNPQQRVFTFGVNLGF